MSISSKAVDIVLQGAVVQESLQTSSIGTAQIIASLRSLLPEAYIILSTWEGSKTEGIDADEIILSKDPGVIWSLEKGSRNLNRMLVSTKAGLAGSRRKYCLKTRTDLPLYHTGFLRLYAAWSGRKRTSSLLKDRILISNNFTKSSRRSHYIFSPSDTVQFGFAEDLKELWNIPLYHWSSELTKNEVISDNEIPEWYWASEQYLWVKNLQKSSTLIIPRKLSKADHAGWEKMLAENFIVISTKEFGVKWRAIVTLQCWAETINFDEWRGLYLKHSRKYKYLLPVPSVIIKNCILKLSSRNNMIFNIYSSFYHWVIPDGRNRQPVRGAAFVKALCQKFNIFR